MFISDFNTFMHSQTSHDRKHVCCYCLHSFSATKILEGHIHDCFESNGQWTIQMGTKGKTVKFQNFIIYDFENILAPENNEKQNLDYESYTNKYQNHVGCCYNYKLVRVDDQLSIPFKPYLGQDAVHNKFITIWLKKPNIAVA